MAAKRRILVQWIGHSDLRALATALPAAKAKKILDRIKGTPGDAGELGPTKTLLTTQKFDEVRLLSNYDKEWNKWFQDWLKTPTELIKVDLEKPTDYSKIFEVVDRELSDLKQSKTWANTELNLHLSPGTPAMSAVLLLLGKTRYPATFYESSRDGKSWITQIPFDLIDIIPEILRNPDAHLQHLASRAPAEIEGFEDIAGDSRAIRDAVGRAQRAAIRNVSILLVGESGTGKEMFAQAIHKSSQRHDKPLKTVNCAALSKELLASELFGHRKGAFTGADSDFEGLFEAANGGTLFLDEIGECDLEIQAKLLRVLQPITGDGASIRHICRLGETKERKVDVRIIAATNKDLFTAIQEGEFREDLFYRLANLSINLPPLRDRKSDIPKIAERLLGMLNQQFEAEELGYNHKFLSGSAIAFVKSQPWKGNVRQLYNALLQAAILTDGSEIGKKEIASSIADIPDSSRTLNSIMDRPLGDDFDLEEHLNEIHRNYLERALDDAHGVKAEAARLLGIKSYQTLDAQLKRLGVQDTWNNKNKTNRK